MDADFLLARADDLLMLGVRMTGVTIDPGTATALAGDGARIVLYLPPQHTAEEAVTDPPPSDWVAGAQLAGVSRVAFDLSALSRFLTHWPRTAAPDPIFDAESFSDSLA